MLVSLFVGQSFFWLAIWSLHLLPVTLALPPSASRFWDRLFCRYFSSLTVSFSLHVAVFSLLIFFLGPADAEIPGEWSPPSFFFLLRTFVGNFVVFAAPQSFARPGLSGLVCPPFFSFGGFCGSLWFAGRERRHFPELCPFQTGPSYLVPPFRLKLHFSIPTTGARLAPSQMKLFLDNPALLFLFRGAYRWLLYAQWPGASVSLAPVLLLFRRDLCRPFR